MCIDVFRVSLFEYCTHHLELLLIGAGITLVSYQLSCAADRMELDSVPDSLQSGAYFCSSEFEAELSIPNPVTGLQCMKVFLHVKMFSYVWILCAPIPCGTNYAYFI